MLRDEYMIFIVMTIMALGLTFVFGKSMGGYKPMVLIVDEDKSEYSKMLVTEIKDYQNFKYDIASREEGIRRVEEGKVLTSVIIEDGFEKNVKKGQSPTINIAKIKDDTDISILKSILTSATTKVGGNIEIANTVANYVSNIKENTRKEDIFDRAYNKAIGAWKYSIPITVKKDMINIGSGNDYDALKHSMIGFALFFSMYTMVFGIGTILYDRQYNTLDRMLISPISRSAILGGSMIVTFLIGVIQLAIIILSGTYIFNIDWGNSILGILTIAGAFVFAVTSLGLMLSGIVKTRSQLSAITPVVLTSTAMLGGCMWPLEIVNSKTLLFLSNFTPQKWAIEGMEKIATYGEGFNASVVPSFVLLGMGVVFFGLGLRTMKIE